ncbi:MAG: lipopolysaccharide biosynthesis protein [Erysipelotrichaceae bacterium]|nr:lipopolysaccharide biosynthesis protein [Erysipelotrichaceae bacterium]
MLEKKEPSLKRKVFGGLIWKFSERIIAQIVTLIVSIVLARILLPEDYGAIALVMVFIAIADALVSGGFGTALIQKKDADNVDFSSVFYFSLFFSTALYIVLFICAPFISMFYDMHILTPVFRVIGVRIIISGINSVQQAYVSRTMMFKRFFWSTLFGTVISGVIGILMAYCGFGIWALVAQYMVNSSVDTLVLWFTVKWRPALILSLNRIKNLFSYGWKILIATLMETVYNQLRSLIIGKVFSKADLAFYDRGQQFPSIIVNNINTSIGAVIFPVLSQKQEDLNAVKSLTKKAIRVSSFCIWPLMIWLIVSAKPIVEFVLTEKWVFCVPFLQIACLSLGFHPIQTANLEALKAIGKSGAYLKIEIIKKIIGIGLIIASVNYGVIAIAYSALVFSVICTFINSYKNGETLKYGFLEQMKDMLPNLIVACIAGIAALGFSLLNLNSLVLIIIQLLVCVAVYLFIARLMKNDSYYYIKGIIVDIVKKK